jgi:outer membrane lipoprotein-sorting protein
MNIGVGTAGLSFKNLGTEACGSLTCYKYQVSDTAIPGKQYVWFDTSSYKLRRWQYINGSDTTDMTLSYSTVTITAPSPVQSVSQLGISQ